MQGKSQVRTSAQNAAMAAYPTVFANTIWMNALHVRKDLRLLVPISSVPGVSINAILAVADFNPENSAGPNHPYYSCVVQRIKTYPNLKVALDENDLVIPRKASAREMYEFYESCRMDVAEPCAAISVSDLLPVNLFENQPVETLDEMPIYDERSFPQGSFCYKLRVCASPLDEWRRTLSSWTQGFGRASLAQMQELQQKMAQARTRVTLDLFEWRDGHVVHHPDRSRILFETTSAPLIAYVDPMSFTQETESVLSTVGLEFPWKGENATITQGKEALRCWMLLFDGKIVIMYERQFLILDIDIDEETSASSTGKTEIKKITSNTIIGDVQITAKIIEAAGALLVKDGDCVIVGIYTPETATVTYNSTCGWFVMDGNIPADRVQDAYAQYKQPSMTMTSSAQAITHLRQSWRNFIHVHYGDGTQLVIKDIRSSYGQRLQIAPFANLSLQTCSEAGLYYLKMQMEGIARTVVGMCTHHAALKDNVSTKTDPQLKDTFPYWYDQEGTKTRAVLEREFHEMFVEEGYPRSRLVITQEYDMLLSDPRNAPINAFCQNPNSLTKIILDGKTSSSAIFDNFISRYLRALISAIYMYYAGRVPAGHSQLAHMIWRYGAQHLSERLAHYSFLTAQFQWIKTTLTARTDPHPLKGIMNAAIKANKADKSDIDNVQNLFVAYVMNRSYDDLNKLLTPLNDLYDLYLKSK